MRVFLLIVYNHLREIGEVVLRKSFKFWYK